MAKASPARSGDYLAGVARRDRGGAHGGKNRPRRRAAEALSLGSPHSYEDDEVTRLILDGHDVAAFAEISHLTVGDFRNWLLSDFADSAALARIAPE